MYIEMGPAHIVVTGEKDGRPFVFDEGEAKEYLSRILGDVGSSLPVLKQKGRRIRNPFHMPPVALTMVEAVNVIDGVSLTPMAAVAGAVADFLKEELKRRGPDFVSVNNGGDISVFNGAGRKVRIGVGDIEKGGSTPYVLEIGAVGDWGLATSGFGGRSLTRGLADMVTVLAPTGAVADAAATSICNATYVEAKQVVRRRAGELDPCSDIADEEVTVSVGALDRHVVKTALARGLEWAEALKACGLILDAIIALRGSMVVTSGDDKNIYVEVNNGDQETGDHRGGRVR